MSDTNGQGADRARRLTEGRDDARQPEVAGLDAEILDGLARGDTPRALGLCIERHGASIGRLSMALLGSQEGADEATLQTLLQAQQRFREYRGEGSLRAWLLGIARNECLRQLEKRRRDAKRGTANGADAAPQAEETRGAAQREERAERARALLERVRPSDRDALLLRFLSDLSCAEVAAACGIDEATARKRVSGALMRLRSAVEAEHDDE